MTKYKGKTIWHKARPWMVLVPKVAGGYWGFGGGETAYDLTFHASLKGWTFPRHRRRCAGCATRETGGNKVVVLVENTELGWTGGSTNKCKSTKTKYGEGRC